jgi:hypothetical protein
MSRVAREPVRGTVDRVSAIVDPARHAVPVRGAPRTPTASSAERVRDPAVRDAGRRTPSRFPRRRSSPTARASALRGGRTTASSRATSSSARRAGGR